MKPMDDIMRRVRALADEKANATKKVKGEDLTEIELSRIQRAAEGEVLATPEGSALINAALRARETTAEDVEFLCSVRYREKYKAWLRHRGLPDDDE